MATYNYPKYKIIIDPDSKKTQGLKVGDIARRQYFDYPNLIYSLMIVIETGVDIIGEKESHYFIGALIEGDEPASGEILDFVRTTNLFDIDRSGALYLTASDDGAPFMDVIDGLSYENSLSFPYMGGGNNEEPNRNKYSCAGEKYVDISYKASEQDASRILRLTKNSFANINGDFFGLKQPIDGRVENPQRVIVSYKIRGSKEKSNLPVQFGYTNNQEIDGEDNININTEWTYKLHLINVDFPSQYQRSYFINLSDYLVNSGDWCEIADLNIVRQSDISNFANATKARIGKVSGIIDPIFGLLDGYGAYFQNLYATKNVNIAGTLTAGDEHGFSSTFYVGKIHKNVINNSIDVTFIDTTTIKIPEKNIVGIGCSWQMGHMMKMCVQSSEWRKEHLNKFYCFSFWAKCKKQSTLSLYQDEFHVDDIIIDSEKWKRYKVAFLIKDSDSDDMTIRMDASVAGIIISAPQMEFGKSPSQYQPTDGTLNYVEDYGAWFSRGGIGGTIQNPLLKLNNDGSISSKDNSFVINPDGTGHFSSGRFKWTKDTITLQDVTIRWESFDEEAQDILKPKSVKLTGTDAFSYPDEISNNVCEPNEIYVFASETNFTGTSRKWLYLSDNNIWKDLPGNNDYIKILPTAHYWEDRAILTIKYISTYKSTEYEDTFTIFKHFDGESAYSIQIMSNRGTVFRNGIISTALMAFVYKGGEDVTDKIPEHNFRWKRISEDPESDMLWNSTEHMGKIIEITNEDVFHKAVFDCEVKIALA